jgi:hypothetical protein
MSYLQARNTTDPDDERIDPEILPLCDALYSAGFEPISSCCRHGLDNPHVCLSGETPDARFEALYQFVESRRVFDYAPWHLDVQKDLRLDRRHVWYVVVHLWDVYSDTGTAVTLQKAVKAILECAALVREFCGELPDILGAGR